MNEQEKYQLEREQAALRKVAARMDASLGRREEALPGRREKRALAGLDEQSKAENKYDVLRYRR